ncbi:MAG: hypothetical protein ACTS5V_07625 [Giesbergeria sp.]
MNRDKLEHLIRASGVITHQYEFVILGRQSISAHRNYFVAITLA